MKKTLLISLLLGALAGTDAVAQSMTERAQTGETRQGEIQASSHALVDELDAMIDEYQRNGLNGEEIKNLKSLRVVLTKLSDKDMAKILALLQQAGTQNDPAAALKVIAAAYSQQKGVLVEMKQILAAYANDEEALEVSNSAQELADRQAANVQAGIETARWAMDRNNQAALDASLQGQAAEQKAINDEMKLLESKIADFAKNPNNKELADRFNQGLEETATLAPILATASDSLDQKRLFDAVTSEKTAGDQMRQLARTIAPPRDDADVLRESSEQLDKIISQQKDVIATTAGSIALPIQDYIANDLKMKQRSTVYRLEIKNGLLDLPVDQLAQQKPIQNAYNGYKGGKINNADGLENREGELANQSDSLSQDLEKLVKPAADALDAAIPPIQAARSALTDKDIASAVNPENDALADFEKAQAALEAQLADAEKADEQSGDPIADLQETQKQTQALMQDQAALNNGAAAPTQQAAAQQQAALQQKAQQLQQQAASAAPAASQSLANAASNMQQAAGAMGNPPQAQQAQAMQNLAKANGELSQQIGQLQQAAQQLADANKAVDEVEKLIEAEQKLQGDTTQAAPRQEQERAAVQALAPRQQGIQGETNDFQKTLTADPQQPNGDARVKTAASASAHMGDAHGHLEQGDGTAATPDETKALDDLYALKDALDAQVQAEQSQLGAAPAADAQADQSTADAAAAVAQAQATVAQAMQAIPPGGQGANPKAAGELSQAANHVGTAAAQAAGLPGGAEQAMRDAAGAMASAAAQAAAGQDTQAKGSGQQAQQALAQAAAALAQSQAGIASAASPAQPGAPAAPGGPPSPASTPGAPASPGGAGSSQPGDGSQSASARAQFLGLPPRDRATIEQSQSEKYPPEYAAKVEQYLENLANDNARQ